MSRKLMLLLAASAALTACKREAEAPAPAPEAATPPAAAHTFTADITEGDFADMVNALASDEFEGRAPGSVGEEKTTAYLEAQMKRIGLQPGNNGSYFQDVPMVETTADEAATTLSLTTSAGTRALKFGTDYVIGTRTGETQVKLDASELVFVGYGVDAPEQKWNDYAGQDWTGKTVVMFVNDPGFHAKDETLFGGNRMTYYGRWTYKFEEAARKGAAAALIVHDTPGASYGWDVVKNSWAGPQYDLPAKDDPEKRIPMQGWLSAEAAKQLFADAGLDLDAAYASAGKRGFKPVSLKAKASASLTSTITEKTSRNVIGVLPGSSKPDEAVLYMAHWDHLGKHEGEGDQIYNGAVDNATGVAGMLEIAGAFAAQEPAPARSVAFVAVTLEESGLLGSKYYVAHPAFPMAKTVAAINLDAMSVSGASRDMVVVGKGSSELEDILATVADEQQRTLVEESNPAGGYYFRSDHFNFAKAGVPALYAEGGEDLVEGGAEAGKAAGEDYTAKRYHKPDDEFSEDWDLTGVIQDLEALYAVGREIAGSGDWPEWREGNPFRAAREASLADAGATTAPAPESGPADTE